MLSSPAKPKEPTPWPGSKPFPLPRPPDDSGSVWLPPCLPRGTRTRDPWVTNGGDVFLPGTTKACRGCSTAAHGAVSPLTLHIACRGPRHECNPIRHRHGLCGDAVPRGLAADHFLDRRKCLSTNRVRESPCARCILDARKHVGVPARLSRWAGNPGPSLQCSCDCSGHC